MTKKQNKQLELFKQLIPERDTEVISALHQKPELEKGDDMPHIQFFKDNFLQEADILYLPEDQRYKYCLVVVDAHSKKCDAQAVKNLESSTIAKAFSKIYKRKILNYPKIIQVDSGSEFKNDTTIYFREHKVIVKKTKTDRHRTNSLVEYKNKIIGGNIFRIQNEAELRTGEPNKDWLDILPKLIDIINDNLPKPINKELSREPFISKNNRDIIPIGAEVRIKLEAPEAIAPTNKKKKLHGLFRESDIRFTRKIFKVDDFIMKAGYPILYTIEGQGGTGYTFQQLQRVKPVEFV